MKRIFVLLFLTILLSGWFLSAQNKEEATYEPVTLIDFTQLEKDYPSDKAEHNSRTTVDFSSQAGTTISEQDKTLLLNSLALDKWEIDLASSSDTVENQTYSNCKYAKVVTGDLKGKNVLGIRIHFPLGSYNSWAMIRPAFEIPAYMPRDQKWDKPSDGNTSGNDKFDGFGILKNVQLLKEVSIRVLGRNFPHAIGLKLQWLDGREQNVFFGNLDFEGWKNMVWVNPNYITEVKNRNLYKQPLYPESEPVVKLAGIYIYRDASFKGGDFITYVRDIRLTYDRARLDTQNADVDDEDLWGILRDREQSRRNAEIKRMGNIQLMRYIEKKKMYDGKKLENEK